MKKRFYKPVAITLTVILTACFTAGCGSGKGFAPDENAIYYDTQDAAAPVPAGASNGLFETEAAMAMEKASVYMDGAEGMYEDGMEGTYEEEMDSDSERLYLTLQDSGGAPSGESAPVTNTRRKLIRTVGLSVETTDFDNLLESIRQSVTEQGGYIESSDVSGTSISYSSNGRRYAYLKVRVPADKLDGFLSQMNEQSNVTNRSENVQDVTLQYTDIESRKKSLTIEQERLWALLEKADTLEAVIALEERLSEIRYELEGFESRLRTYDNQVDYSTVDINISEVTIFTPTVPDSVAVRIQKGFIRNLENVGTSMTDFAVWFISHLPALTVLVVIIGAAVFFVKLLSPFRLKKRGTKKIHLKKVEKDTEEKNEEGEKDN